MGRPTDESKRRAKRGNKKKMAKANNGRDSSLCPYLSGLSSQSILSYLHSHGSIQSYLISHTHAFSSYHHHHGFYFCLVCNSPPTRMSNETQKADQIAFHVYTKLSHVVNHARTTVEPRVQPKVDKWVSFTQPYNQFPWTLI